MFPRIIQILIFVLFLTAASVFGQNGDGTTPLFPRGNERDERPKSIREQLKKLQIEKDKKDHAAMLVRGDEALKISEELEVKANSNARLDAKDKEKLESLEKILKKIRSELGGDDDDDAESTPQAVSAKPNVAEATPNTRPKDVVDGIKSLRSATVKLVDELQKTTRFTISAAAIQTTNAVLRITRVLRFWN